MSKQKLFTTRGFLLTNASRLRTETSRSKPPIEPKDEPHANGCGCVRCRVTHRVDKAIDRQLGSKSDSGHDALAPTPGVFNSRSKRAGKGPLMPTRGVLAGDAS